MLSKVANRVKRPLVQFSDTTTTELVENAPDLLRWSNFADPFPTVSYGGYARYYSKMNPSFPKSPTYCPVLSHYPEPSPSRETPATSPLFSFPQTTKRCLAVIHEVSMESMTAKKPQKPQNLVISTRASLRRRRRQLLRTPSIERDFAVNSRHLFASSSMSVNDTSSMDVPMSPISHGSTHSHSSDSSQSDVNQSEYPITPSTSLDSRDEVEVLARLYLQKEVDWRTSEELPKRPESRTSFSTAKSDFDVDDNNH